MSICKYSRLLFVVLVCFAVVVGGCASSVRFASTKSIPRSTSSGSARTDDGNIVRVKHDRVLLTLEGVASFYADDFHGKLTSNGEVFDMHDLTAAHRTLPFDSKVRVTNLENDKSIVVRINDRGPFVDGRMIDLSLGAAKELDMVQKGTARVKLEVLEWGDGAYKRNE
jgi:rare lipoprotein A